MKKLRELLDRNFGCISSIRTKILVVSLSIALGTTVASLAIAYYAQIRTIKNVTETYTTQYVSFADEKFHEMLTDARNILLAVASETEIIAPGLVSASPEASYLDYQQKKKIKSFLAGLISQKDYIDNVMVVTQQGRIYQANSELIMRKDLEEPTIQKALAAERMGLFYDRESRQMYMSCPIFQRVEKEAAVLIRLNYDKLVTVWHLEPLEAMDIYIYGKDGSLFYTNALENGREKELFDKVQAMEASSGELTLQGEKQFFISHGAGAEEMTAISVMPWRMLLQDARTLRNRLLLIGLGAAAAAFGAAFYLSGRLCSDLNCLTESMQQIRKGNLDIRSAIQSKDEVGLLADSFNEMMDRLRALLEEVRTKERLKREAERDVLATQIEPHFLYNTIDSIQYVAHMQKQEEIEQVAAALSELLRSVLSNHDECITLWEEREYIENYMMIERFKYRQPFLLVWDVDEMLWGVRIPKLLLQPIVENSLLHGIAQKETEGLIQVKVYRQGAELIVKILDNGKGMGQEQIDRLMEEVTRTDKAGFRRVGLANVFNRIRLIYGEEYGGQIYSCEDMFTCVELRLPAQEK